MTSRERWAPVIVSGRYVRVTWSNKGTTVEMSGYIGDVHEDTFELGVVMNSYEHFSNHSAAPELQQHVIHFADVVSASD